MWCRRSVAQAAMRADLVVLATQVLDEDLHLLEGVEDLSVEQFVPKPTIEPLTVPVLPRYAWLDEQRCDVEPIKPFTNCPGAELGAVV